MHVPFREMMAPCGSSWQKQNLLLYVRRQKQQVAAFLGQCRPSDSPVGFAPRLLTSLASRGHDLRHAGVGDVAAAGDFQPSQPTLFRRSRLGEVLDLARVDQFLNVVSQGEEAGHASVQTTARHYVTDAMREAAMRLPYAGAIVPESCRREERERRERTA